MNRYISILVVVMAFVGCTSVRISQNLSSGVIGCKPEEIAIFNETATAMGSMHNWEALCKGKHFICSYQPTTGVNCKEAIQSKEERPLDVDDKTIKETTKDGRFIAYHNGTVLDTRTGLMWAAKDNGSNINWANAKFYCENYRGGGYKDWRMPTQDELAGFYDAGKIQQNEADPAYLVHLTELIDLTSCCPWTSETRGPDAAYFDFRNGLRDWLPQSYDDLFRALPVRSAK
jgi:hypothetical protein